MWQITDYQRQLQPYCSGHCRFVPRYVQLICLVRLLNMVLCLILTTTEGEENLCIREDSSYSRHTNVPIMEYHIVMTTLKHFIAEKAADTIQKVITIM